MSDEKVNVKAQWGVESFVQHNEMIYNCKDIQIKPINGLNLS